MGNPLDYNPIPSVRLEDTLKLDRVPRKGFDAAIRKVASHIRDGESAMILNGNHFNPDHDRLLSDERAVFAFSKAGAHDFILELPPEAVVTMNVIKAGHLSRTESADAIRDAGLQSAQAVSVGREDESVSRLSDLIENTARYHVTLHGYDPCLQQSKRAFAHMVPQLQAAAREAGNNLLAIPGSIEYSTLTPAQKMANGIIYAAMAVGRLEDAGPIASPVDVQVSEAIVVDLGSRPFVAQYGAGHSLSFRGIDHLVAERTGRHITTIAYYDSASAPVINRIISHHNSAVSVPDFLFDRDHLYERRPDILLIKGCEEYENWPTKLCSTDITDAPSKPPHSPVTRTTGQPSSAQPTHNTQPPKVQLP